MNGLADRPEQPYVPHGVEWVLPSQLGDVFAKWSPNKVEFGCTRTDPAPGTVIGWDESRAMFYIMAMGDITKFVKPEPWDGTVPE